MYKRQITDCAVTVGSINEATGNVVQVIGVGSDKYNGLHRITSVDSTTRLSYSGNADNDFSASAGFIYHVGVSTAVTNILHDRLSGIATVTLQSDIGLRRGDEIVITDANSVYNGTHTITDRVGYGSSLKVNIGRTASQPAFSGASAVAYGSGISAKGFNQTMPIYGGFVTELNSAITCLLYTSPSPRD